MLIKNGRIHTMAAAGTIQADIRVQNGKIAAIGENLKEETGELIIDASGKQVFPGMIEAHCHLGMEESAIRGEGDDVNEMSDPITPQVRAIDGCNPLDETIINARNAGITTVAAGPEAPMSSVVPSWPIKHTASALMKWSYRIRWR